MNGAGTNKTNMTSAKDQTSKANVIEILDKFDDMYTDTLIDKLVDDFDNYKGHYSSSWHWFNDDAAKPYIDKFATAMYERAKDINKIIEANGKTEYLKDESKAMNDAVEKFKKWQSKGLTDMSKQDKEDLVEVFNNLRNSIKAVEEKLYIQD